MTDAAIAMNRFGLGARADEAPPGDPKRDLIRQFDRFEIRPPALADAATTAAVAAELVDYAGLQQRLRQQKAAAPVSAAGAAPTMASSDMSGGVDAAQAAVRFARRQNRDFYTGAIGARMNAALTTPAPFVERLVHFWANHFAVSADKQQVVGLAGPFEFEAIRPHVLGRFRDMVFAVERHPAMLLYLDQAQSGGPNSPAALRRAQGGNGRAFGLNENLAREIMELHTLGVRTGYTQADVTEFARALTGWTAVGIGRGPGPRQASGQPGEFAFVARLHEPGARTIMGKGYAQTGEAQADAVLSDLSVHPATARHIATKLVRHFIADDPPAPAVARVEAAFLTSGGDLPTVYRALIDAPEAWAAASAKFKTPWEWSVSALRALGLKTLGPTQSDGLLQQLGQPTWKPGSPAGWDDIAGSWAGPDAVLRRVEAAERFAGRAGAEADPRARAAALFPGALSAATAQGIARAESPQQGMALLLVSPEFMRR